MLGSSTSPKRLIWKDKPAFAGVHWEARLLILSDAEAFLRSLGGPSILLQLQEPEILKNRRLSSRRHISHEINQEYLSQYLYAISTPLVCLLNVPAIELIVDSQRDRYKYKSTVNDIYIIRIEEIRCCSSASRFNKWYGYIRWIKLHINTDLWLPPVQGVKMNQIGQTIALVLTPKGIFWNTAQENHQRLRKYHKQVWPISMCHRRK